jgi:hypothetical protein
MSTWVMGMSVGAVMVVAMATAAADCPDLPAIQRAAERFAGVDAPPSWRGRARWSALVPIMTMRARDATAWSEVPRGGVIEEVDRDQSLEVRLTWRLDRLVFDPAEPRLAESERRVRRARIELRQEVAAAYFRWRRALDDGEPIATAETHAHLDAFTGGWLARQPCACPCP